MFQGVSAHTTKWLNFEEKLFVRTLFNSMEFGCDKTSLIFNLKAICHIKRCGGPDLAPGPGVWYLCVIWTWLLKIMNAGVLKTAVGDQMHIHEFKKKVICNLTVIFVAISDCLIMSRHTTSSGRCIFETAEWALLAHGNFFTALWDTWDWALLPLPHNKWLHGKTRFYRSGLLHLLDLKKNVISVAML